MSGAIHSFLEVHTSYVVCGEAGDGNAAIEKAKEHRCAMIVLDLGMSSKPTGVDTALALRQALPQAKIVAFSTVTAGSEAHDVIGVDAFLTKREGLAELTRIVRTLMAGTDPGQPN